MGAFEHFTANNKRKRIEEIFGWLKSVGGCRQTKFRGLERVGMAFTLALAAAFTTATASVTPGLAGAYSSAVVVGDTDGAADIDIEPSSTDETWVRNNMVDAAELLDVLGSRFTLSSPHRDDPSAPAEEWLVEGYQRDGGPATVGIIASVTRSFCEACDRTRLTAEGTVRSCLFGDDETDLRALLRSGADDAAIADRWRAAQWQKQQGHGISRPDFVRPLRSMGAIGG